MEGCEVGVLEVKVEVIWMVGRVVCDSLDRRRRHQNTDWFKFPQEQCRHLRIFVGVSDSAEKIDSISGDEYK